ncbi:MAG TPA: methyltransferase domain-containing protein [Thermoanaerobaculia bacterium]|nr:methyltransferase domain-containing protein [Thermoanaerobaculia bacterium]
MTLEEWNGRYRSGEELDREPASQLVAAASDLPPGRALDLACGAGRNAIWLERRGWNVVAIDGASEAIRIVGERAPAIDARVLDLETNAPLPFDDESFDLVAVLFFLHRPLFPEAKRLVRRGGIVVAAMRTCGINPSYCVASGELAKHFRDFELLHEHEDEVAEIVARKPGSLVDIQP